MRSCGRFGPAGAARPCRGRVRRSRCSRSGPPSARRTGPAPCSRPRRRRFLSSVRPVPRKYSIVRVVDREEAHRRAVLGRHVGDGGAVGHRERFGARRRRTRRTCPRPSRLRSISVTVSTRSVAVTPSRSRPVKLTADHVGRQEVHRLAEHAGLGLDAADAPADHADAVDHRGVAVGADQGVGVVDAVAVARCTPRARYSRLTWCTMPMPGGTTLKVSNACMPHFMNS